MVVMAAQMLLDYIVGNGKKFSYVYCYTVKDLEFLPFGDKDTQQLPQKISGHVHIVNFFSSHPSFGSGASAKKGQSQAGRRWAAHSKQSPFLKSAPESPSTACDAWA